MNLWNSQKVKTIHNLFRGGSSSRRLRILKKFPTVMVDRTSKSPRHSRMKVQVQKNVTSIMSLVYLERKWIQERKYGAEKPKLNRTKQISTLCSEYHRGKARYTPIRQRRKDRATQDPQDRLRILQHQIILNERAIQAKRDKSRESMGTRQKH
jgi:hypothetical protein